MSQPKMNSEAASNTDNTEHHPVAIVGGGIGGLVLALCLDQVYNHNTTNNKTTKKLPIHVYESTTAYTANAGGAIGLYANGLRVLRNLNDAAPNLLEQVRKAGCDYKYRRWMRHDGLEVAVAREDELLPDLDDNEDEDESGAATANNTTATGGDSSSAVDADKRPRGGSFGLISKLTHRLSGISLSSSSTTTTTTTSSSSSSPRIETELQSLGIRRWKYQQVLYEACIEAGIEIHFGKRLQTATTTTNTTDSNSAKTLLQFKDGSKLTTSLLIGADGINSKVRNYIVDPTTTIEQEEKHKSLEEFLPEYTGVTCLMGCANVPFRRGICFPSSATTKCHACYYPTRVPAETEKEEEKEGNTDDGNNENTDTTNNSNDNNNDNKYEMVFQIYFPSPIERPDTWRTLTPDEAKIECQELALKLREDGWEEQFLGPLESTSLKGVLRVGLRSREALDVWHVGGEEEEDGSANVGKAVLLGDAAHPPVPYIGQGAQMAMEDAGTLSLLLGHFCPLNDSGDDDDYDEAATIDLSNFQDAMKVYEKLRVPRTKTVLGSSVQLGKTQQKRADSMLYNAWRELSIKAQVWAYGTLPVMRPGAAFNYHTKVEEALKELETTTM